MNAFPSPHGIDRRSGQSGFTLVELMIAVLIGLFLVGGLLTLTSAMKRTSGVQNDLSQLHDTERLSLSLMADVIQSSGYFLYPSPPGTTTVAGTFPSGTIGGTTWVAGQTISGTDVGSGSTQTDTVSVRYTSFGGDGVLNCIGGTVAAATNWVAKFRVDGSDNLVCDLTTNGAATPVTTILASGVRYMQILYGVQTNAASGTFSVDSYLTATQVAAGPYWPSVISVQVTLSFVNPLYCATACQAGQQTTQPQTISMSRTIALMNKAGVNTI
jgi:type IV pilus assembly protein PilW